MQQRSEETYTRILSAAAQLFSQLGYNATSVAEICAAASVSKGAFYYHFATKQALFIELLNQWLEGLDSAFESLRQESVDVPQALRAMAKMVGQVFQSSDSNHSIILEFWMQAYRDPAIWQAAIAPYQRYVHYFASMYEQGIEEGSLGPMNPESAARTTFALAIGILLQAIFDQQKSGWDDEVLQGVETLLYGLLRRPV
jgi:AcrR family transcriptional regulator